MWAPKANPFESAVNYFRSASRQPDLSVNVGPRLSWVRRCLFNGIDFTKIPCAICRNGYLITSTEVCPVVAPLVYEFLSGPLTLMQLTRIEIRRLIGVRYFERRVDTLKQQLPSMGSAGP